MHRTHCAEERNIPGAEGLRQTLNKPKTLRVWRKKRSQNGGLLDRPLKAKSLALSREEKGTDVGTLFHMKIQEQEKEDEEGEEKEEVQGWMLRLYYIYIYIYIQWYLLRNNDSV